MSAVCTLGQLTLFVCLFISFHFISVLFDLLLLAGKTCLQAVLWVN